MRIDAVLEGVFHAELEIDDGSRDRRSQRGPPTRGPRAAPGAEIVAEEEVLAEAGVETADDEEDEVEKFKEFLDEVSAEDFDTETES